MKSRKFNEWKLNTKVFNKLCAIWQKPDIDLFASRLNYQIDKFCSWEPDPQATFINAFTIDWSCFEYIYVFPPFSVLNRCIRKIKTDKASGLIIAPYWPTQIWFPSLMEILTDNPILIPVNASSSRKTSSIGKEADTHCLSSIRENFRSRGLSETSTRILMASWKYSTKKQYHSYIKKWFIYCRERKIDKFRQLWRM